MYDLKLNYKVPVIPVQYHTYDTYLNTVYYVHGIEYRQCCVEYDYWKFQPGLLGSFKFRAIKVFSFVD